MNRMQRERRYWLKKASLLVSAGAASTFTGLSAIDAFAQEQDDYRALVCVFLFGGNDSFNMFVPRTGEPYNLYSQARSAHRGITDRLRRCTVWVPPVCTGTCQLIQQWQIGRCG